MFKNNYCSMPIKWLGLVGAGCAVAFSIPNFINPDYGYSAWLLALVGFMFWGCFSRLSKPGWHQIMMSSLFFLIAHTFTILDIFTITSASWQIRLLGFVLISVIVLIHSVMFQLLFYYIRFWPLIVSLPLAWISSEYLVYQLFLQGQSFSTLLGTDIHAAWLRSVLPLAGVWGCKWLTLSFAGWMSDSIIPWLTRYRHKPTDPTKAKPLCSGGSLLTQILMMGFNLFLLVCGNAFQSDLVAGLQNTPNYAITLMHTQQPPPTVASSMVIQKAYYQFVSNYFNHLPNQTSPPLMVWPESTLILGEGAVDRLHNAKKLPQLIGIQKLDRTSTGMAMINALYLTDGKGRLIGQSGKQLLIPLVEQPLAQFGRQFMLLTSLLEWGATHFQRGQRHLLPWPVSGQLIPIGAVICYESIFALPLRELTRQGSEVLAVAGNSWYLHHNSLAAQHAWYGAFRAAENGRFLIFVVNGGYSTLYSPIGLSTQAMPTHYLGWTHDKIQPVTVVTPYTRYGDWLPLICIIVPIIYGLFNIVVAAFLTGKQRSSRQRHT